MKKRIIVIGGGMAGTSAAHYLTEKGYEVTILEKNNRLGGRIRTETIDGIAVEYGAQFISNMYPNVRSFLKKHGLHKHLYKYGLFPAMYRNGKVSKYSLKTALDTSMLSWKAKFLLPLTLIGPLLHWRAFNPSKPELLASYDDVSITDHFSSKTGRELLDHAFQPVFTGAFYWLPKAVEKTSEAMLLFASKALVLGGFRKFKVGLQHIPEMLAKGSTVLLSCTVDSVEKNKNGEYVVRTGDDSGNKILVADGIVCATTASVVPKIFSDLTPTQLNFFKSINYSSVSYMGQTYRKCDVKEELNIVLPKPEKVSLSRLSILYPRGVSCINPDVALMMAGTVESLPDQNEETICNVISKEVRVIQDDVFHPHATPLSTFTWHWEEALPILETGYFKRLKRFLKEESGSTEPLFFAGDYLSSPFMEGAFSSGMNAAEHIDHLLNAKN